MFPQLTQEFSDELRLILARKDKEASSTAKIEVNALERDKVERKQLIEELHVPSVAPNSVPPVPVNENSEALKGKKVLIEVLEDCTKSIITPEYTFSEDSDFVNIQIQLPLAQKSSDFYLDILSNSLHLHSDTLPYDLKVNLPNVDIDAPTKAKFDKKKKELNVQIKK